jgi:hypothetical protein
LTNQITLSAFCRPKKGGEIEDEMKDKKGGENKLKLKQKYILGEI